MLRKFEYSFQECDILSLCHAAIFTTLNQETTDTFPAKNTKQLILENALLHLLISSQENLNLYEISLSILVEKLKIMQENHR